jgi:hypothetical protein
MNTALLKLKAAIGHGSSDTPMAIKQPKTHDEILRPIIIYLARANSQRYNHEK